MRPCHLFSTSRRYFRNRPPSRLPVSPMYMFRLIDRRCLLLTDLFDDIGEGARELISDLNGSLGSRRFLYFVKERKSFAS